MKLAATLQERFANWALRTRPPEPVPIRLTQRRVYVLPTRAGLLFGMSLLVMLLGAINYNLGLGHVLVFLLVGLGVVAILHTFRNLVGIAIDTGRASPVFAGEIAHFALILHNPHPRERRRIRLALPGINEDVIDIPALATAEARLGLPAVHRGWLALPRITLETTYPLGLIRTWSYAAPAMHCLVYPQPAMDTLPLPASSGDSGGHMQSSRGNEDFAGLRAHQQADPPRHVAWKAAARSDGSAPLLTKQFSGANAAIVWLDWEATPAGLDAEARLSILARWVLDAAAAGLDWGLSLPNTRLPPAGGDAHLHACLKALALYETA
jgi:uncharacterized protein (DUF58 family)